MNVPFSIFSTNHGFRIFRIMRHSLLSETVHFTPFAVPFSKGSFAITRKSTFIQFDRPLLDFDQNIFSFLNKIIISLILKIPKIVGKGFRLLNFSVVKQLRCGFLYFRRFSGDGRGFPTVIYNNT